MNIPFSVYDFFAYLFSGSVVVTTADYIWNLGILERRDIGVPFGVALLILVYVTGQIVAQLSSWLLEHTVAFRILRRPTILLVGGKARHRTLRWTFPNYHRPLPSNVQERIRAQAASRNCSAQGEGLFLHVYPLVTRNEKLQARLDEFRNQYGFARNMSLAFLLSAAMICVAHWYGPHPVRLRWALAAAFVAICLFYRYLKFLHQYAYELLLRYSEL